MKEITLTVACDCGFQIQRVFRTNEHGYFEIPDAYCPDCFQFMVWDAEYPPVDVTNKTQTEPDHRG